MSFRSMLPIHKWAGLTVGLLTLLSAATGAGMAFRKQLDPIVYPREAKAACSAPLNLDQIQAVAKMAHPKGKIDYFRILQDSREPIAVRWMNKDTLYFDRCSNQIVAEQNRYAGVFGIMEWLHRGRWLPEPVGDSVMGLGALNLLGMLVGIGLYLWWPRKGRSFIENFKLNTKLRKGPPFDLGLHRTVGGWVALPLAISAFTALPNAFPIVRDTISLLDVSARHDKSRSLTHGPMLSISKAWAEVQQVSPGAREVLIHAAQKPSQPIEIYIIAVDAPHANARTYLYLDSHTGRVLTYTPYSNMGLGSRIYFWMLSVHTGEVGGILGQLLLFLGAAGALLLGFTGIRTWYRKRANKKRAVQKSKASQVSPAPARVCK